MRIHEYLEIVEDPDGRARIRCIRCGHDFCDAGENYKRHALYRERDPARLPGRGLVSGERTFHVLQEYVCPGCGTLLEVDAYVPGVEGEEPVLWDIQVAPSAPAPRKASAPRKA